MKLLHCTEYFHWIFEFLKHEVENKDKIMKIIKTKNKCFDVFCNLVVMKVKCRGCDKTFSTKSNRNKHERAAGHGPSETGERGIPYDSENDIYLYPTANCITTATTKRSITRHLKKCYHISINRKRNQQNKICGYVRRYLKKNPIGIDM